LYWIIYIPDNIVELFLFYFWLENKSKAKVEAGNVESDGGENKNGKLYDKAGKVKKIKVENNAQVEVIMIEKDDDRMLFI